MELSSILLGMGKTEKVCVFNLCEHLAKNLSLQSRLVSEPSKHPKASEMQDL